MAWAASFAVILETSLKCHTAQSRRVKSQALSTSIWLLEEQRIRPLSKNYTHEIRNTPSLPQGSEGQPTEGPSALVEELQLRR